MEEIIIIALMAALGFTFFMLVFMVVCIIRVMQASREEEI